MNREFNTAEKLLLLLGLILVVVSYYRFVYAPIVQELNSARAERDALEIELNAVQMRLMQLSRMQEELVELDRNSSFTRMASYNDIEVELALLNNVLAPTRSYNIAFQDLSRDGDLVRRSFVLQFTAEDMEAAKRVLTRLTKEGRRCLIGDISCSVEKGSEDTELVHVGVLATFYETMADGEEDLGILTAGSAF